MNPEPSPFLDIADIEYFMFEEDFVEKNVRCIPMTVRFKMDEACIKLKLNEWSKFSVEERIELALMPCNTAETVNAYRNYLAGLISKYTGNEPSTMDYDTAPAWANTTGRPDILQEKTAELGVTITNRQWAGLSNLQRFALLKLCKSGHENKNLPKALKEFGLV